jgi:hypothetical protein
VPSGGVGTRRRTDIGARRKLEEVDFPGLFNFVPFRLLNRPTGPSEYSEKPKPTISQLVWFVFGFGAIIFFPIISGAICGGIGAAIYNLVAGWIGGLEMDIS